MGVSLLVTFFCAFLAITRVPTSVCAAVVKYSGNETFSVLLLASSDPSYDSSPSTLSNRVNELLNEANKNGSYQLQLLSFDTLQVNLSLPLDFSSLIVQKAYTYTYK